MAGDDPGHACGFGDGASHGALPDRSPAHGRAGSGAIVTIGTG